MFAQFLLRYDYGAGAAIERGLSDFLNGPKFLLRPGDITHQSVTSYLAQYQTENLSTSQVDLLKGQHPTKKLRHPAKSFLLNGHMLPSTDHVPQILEHEYVSWKWLTGDSYLQVNSTTGAGQLFRKDAGKFWKLSAKMGVTLIRALLIFDRRKEAFTSSFPSLTSEASWRDYLRMPAVNPKTKTQT